MLPADQRSRRARTGADAALSGTARLVLASPYGPLALVERAGSIVALEWGGKAAGAPTATLLKVKQQLKEYFAGARREFDLPLAPAGAKDEKRLWARMSKIPYGETATYGELARELGLMPRQLGQACGRNPIPIIIPCHRVVGADGALTGYSGHGGVETKRRLLLFEGALLL